MLNFSAVFVCTALAVEMVVEGRNDVAALETMLAAYSVLYVGAVLRKTQRS